MSRHLLQWDRVDPVGDALHSLRMTGTFYCRTELTAPWGLEMPAMDGCLWFHAISAGACEIGGDDFGPVRVAAGDFVLVPHGQGHRLRSAPGVPTPVVLDVPHVMVGDRYAHLRHGGSGAEARMICGLVRFEGQVASALMAGLPRVIHVDRQSAAHAAWMRSSLRLMAAEARHLAPGGETLVTRMADMLVIHAIRWWLQHDTSVHRGWLGALRDPQIGQALTAVHRHPASRWTVDALASAAAMSRSAFAARFTALVGEPPLHYVTLVRMQLARDLLSRDTRLSVESVAERTGYESVAAFSRAFTRVFGYAPGASRRKGMVRAKGR